MPFTVRIAFTGLGVAVIKTDKEKRDYVRGVDLLMVDTESHAAFATHHHIPRLTFQLEDVVPKDGLFFENSNVDEKTQVGFGAGGAPLAELDLFRKDFSLTVDAPTQRDRGEGFKVTRASGAATRSSSGLVENAIDWIPDAKSELELQDAILSPGTLQDSPYVARVRLPAGNVESRGLFISPGGSPSRFTFGDSKERPLAEHVIWSRDDVERLHLGIYGIELDAERKQQRRVDPVVELAVTHLPRRFIPTRYWAPSHFNMLNRISASNKIPKPILPAPGGGVTHGAGCPPVQTETP